MTASLPSWLSKDEARTGVCILSLYCQPGAKSTEVQGEHDGRLKIRLSAPPVDGKANEALIQYLSKVLQVKRADIELLSGDASRSKRIKVLGIDHQRVQQLLCP
jgi:uncharacterized protein (TIGR00251 family)